MGVGGRRDADVDQDERMKCLTGSKSCVDALPRKTTLNAMRACPIASFWCSYNSLLYSWKLLIIGGSDAS